MNEQAFVMTSDQRKCMQRSRFVCRILNFCVKKVLLQIHLWELESAEVALPLRGERGIRGVYADGTHPFRPTVTRKKLEDVKHLRFFRTGSARLSVQFRLREVTRWTKTEFVHSSLVTQPE